MFCVKTEPRIGGNVVYSVYKGNKHGFFTLPCVSRLRQRDLHRIWGTFGPERHPFFTTNSHHVPNLPSPDINGPIEKTWRECQVRVLARADEIRSRKDMIRVIKEEWAGLEFERTERWCGINALVANFTPCLEEIVANGGWDTSYM